MTFEPENEIEELTQESIAAPGVYITTPQEIELCQLIDRPDLLIIRILNQNEQHDRLMKVSKKRFISWMKNKLKLLEPEPD